MRCFVAISVDQQVASAIARTLAALRDAAERAAIRVSWTLPENWHATVKFLGEVDEARTADLCTSLARVAGNLQPFALEATGLTTLPVRARVPKVVAAALDDDGGFASLAAAVEEAMAGLGFAREERAALPHLTIARIREAKAKGWRRFAETLAPLGEHGFGRTEVTEMTFYRSHLGQGPARYEIIERFELGSRK